MKNRRITRVNELLRRSIAEALYRHVDPDEISLAGVMITRAETSPDLRHARIAVSVMGDAATQERVIHLLSSKRKALQRDIGHHVRLKYTPHLHFRLDSSIEHGDKILALIDEVAPESRDNGAGGEHE